MLTPEQRAAGTPTAFADLIERLEQSERDFEAIVKHLTPWFFGFGGGKERMAYIASGVQQDLTDALQALRTLAAENERKTELLQIAIEEHDNNFGKVGDAGSPHWTNAARQALEKNSAGK